MRVLQRQAIFYLWLFSLIRTCDAFVVNPQQAPALGRRSHPRRPTALVRQTPFVVRVIPSHTAATVEESILESVEESMPEGAASKTRNGGVIKTIGQPLVGLTPIPSAQLESRVSTKSKHVMPSIVPIDYVSTKF